MVSGTYTVSTTVTVTAPGKSGGGAVDLWSLALLAGVFFRRAGVSPERIG
jgi:hypothetical protein